MQDKKKAFITETGRKNSVNKKIEDIIDFLSSSITRTENIPSIDGDPFTLEYIPTDVIEQIRKRHKEK